MWGKFEDELKNDLLSSAIIKHFVMTAMSPDPFYMPATEEKPEKPEKLVDGDGNAENDGGTEGLEIDDRVIHIVKLQQHLRTMQIMQDTVKEQASSASQAQMSFPPAEEIPFHPVRPIKNYLTRPLMYMETSNSDFVLGKESPVPELTRPTARQLLCKSVATLVCASGYDASLKCALSTLVDVTEDYIIKMTKALRIAVDNGANFGATGFPDAVDRVFAEMGIGTVHELHTYYQDKVITRHQRLLENCRQANLEYSSLALHVKPGTMHHFDTIAKLEEPDSVPEIHFPAIGEDGVDELQPSLEPGFQMLHSLEQESQMHPMDSQDDSPGLDSSYDGPSSSSKRKRI